VTPRGAARKARLDQLTTAVLSLVAGAAAGVAFPPFGVLPGALGYGLLMLLWDGADAQKPIRSAFWRGWLAGVAFFAIATWWLFYAFLVDAKDQGWMAPFAVALVAAGLGVFWGGAGALYRWMAPSGWPKVLIFAGVFALFEWLRGHVLTGFPWDLPGEVWPAGSALSQGAALVGAYGLSWITLAIAATPFLIAEPKARRQGAVALLAAIAAMAGLYVFGVQRLSHAEPPSPGAPIVRIVQADLPEVDSYTPESYAETVRRHLQLSAELASPTPAIIIWPERSIPGATNGYLAPGTWTYDAITAALKPGQILMTGGFRQAPAPHGAFAPDGLIYFNSLTVVRRDATGLTPLATYDKYRLVPFGEYIPLDRFLAPLGFNDLIHMPAGFSPGPPPQAIAIAWAPPVQPLICYESLYPDFTREGVRRTGVRPLWIVNVSDDAWFGPTSGPLQHLNLAAYRAIEAGLPIVRATPTGVSAIIDAYGRIAPGKSLGEGQMGVIDGPLPPALPPTAFDRFGEAGFGGLMLISAAAALAVMIARRNIKKR
jgi:apolipoprotein N-acyltransferase